MEVSILSIIAFGFILGMKHAVEPDHVIAISTIASKSKKLWRSSLAGAFWGMGHTATLLIVGIGVLLVKGNIPEKWAMSFEFLVGIMLVYLGISSIILFRKKIHVHEHEHDGVVHKHFHSHNQSGAHDHSHHVGSYKKSMFIGAIHGLAGSAAMVLLTMSTMKTVWEGVLYILIFGFGTVAGMLMTTTIIGIPFVLTVRRIRLNRILGQVAGAVSITYGFYYMYNIVTEGLFELWLQ